MVKPSKCVWGNAKLEYLGHMIGEGLMAIPEARVQYVRNFCRPVTSKELRSYLGLMGYYRKFIPGFATIARPLYHLTHRDAPKTVVWTEEALHAFHKLSDSLCDVCCICLFLLMCLSSKLMLHTWG